MDLKNQILVALGLDKGEDVTMAYQAKIRRRNYFRFNS